MVKRLTVLGAWCLLVAAFSDTTWVIAHELFPHEHVEHPIARHVESPDDHPHADQFLAILSSSSESIGKSWPAVSESAAARPPSNYFLTDSIGHPSKSGSSFGGPSAPRAPPGQRA